MRENSLVFGTIPIGTLCVLLWRGACCLCCHMFAGIYPAGYLAFAGFLLVAGMLMIWDRIIPFVQFINLGEDIINVCVPLLLAPCL